MINSIKVRKEIDIEIPKIMKFISEVRQKAYDEGKKDGYERGFEHGKYQDYDAKL